MKNHNYYIFVLSVFLIFFSFDSLQQFTIVLKAKTGYLILALMYIVFAVSLFVAPLILKKLGLKKILILAAFLYSLYGWGLLFNFSVIGGLMRAIGGSFFWVAYPITVLSLSKILGKAEGEFSGKMNSLRVLGSFFGVIIFGLFSYLLGGFYSLLIFSLISIIPLFLLFRLNIEYTEKRAIKIPLKLFKNLEVLKHSVIWILAGFIFGSLISLFPAIFHLAVRNLFYLGLLFSFLYLLLSVSSFFGGILTKRSMYFPIIVASFIGLFLSFSFIIFPNILNSVFFLTFAILIFSCTVGLMESVITAGLVGYISRKDKIEKAGLSAIMWFFRLIGVVFGVTIAFLQNIILVGVILLILFTMALVIAFHQKKMEILIPSKIK